MAWHYLQDTSKSAVGVDVITHDKIDFKAARRSLCTLKYFYIIFTFYWLIIGRMSLVIDTASLTDLV